MMRQKMDEADIRKKTEKINTINKINTHEDLFIDLFVTHVMMLSVYRVVRDAAERIPLFEKRINSKPKKI